MPTDCISYQDSGYFSTLMNDYLNQKATLTPLYNRFPKLENFEDHILEKKNNFDNTKRETLVAVLQKQYLKVENEERRNMLKKLLSNATVKDKKIVSYQFLNVYSVIVKSPKNLTIDEMLGYKGSNLD